NGDMMTLKFDMKPQVLQADHRVVEDFRRVAVQRGPLVYCLEQIDQPEGASLTDVSLDLRKGGSEVREEFAKDLRRGLLGLKQSSALNIRPKVGNAVYRRYSGDVPAIREVELRFIPYYAWANRNPSAMQVWTPVLKT